MPLLSKLSTAPSPEGSLLFFEEVMSTLCEHTHLQQQWLSDPSVQLFLEQHRPALTERTSKIALQYIRRDSPHDFLIKAPYYLRGAIREIHQLLQETLKTLILFEHAQTSEHQTDTLKMNPKNNKEIPHSTPSLAFIHPLLEHLSSYEHLNLDKYDYSIYKMEQLNRPYCDYLTRVKALNDHLQALPLIEQQHLFQAIAPMRPHFQLLWDRLIELDADPTVPNLLNSALHPTKTKLQLPPMTSLCDHFFGPPATDQPGLAVFLNQWNFALTWDQPSDHTPSLKKRL